MAAEKITIMIHDSRQTTRRNPCCPPVFLIAVEIFMKVFFYGSWNE